MKAPVKKAPVKKAPADEGPGEESPGEESPGEEGFSLGSSKAGSKAVIGEASRYVRAAGPRRARRGYGRTLRCCRCA